MKKLAYSLILPYFFFSTIILHAQNWSKLQGLNGLSVNAAILSICSGASGNIYAAGYFTDSNGNYIAGYNGISWGKLGGMNALALNGTVFSICTDPSGNVYAVGAFADGNGSNYAVKYNGTGWSVLGMADLNGSSTSGGLYSICTDLQGNIYTGGNFYSSIGCIYLAKYIDTSFNQLGQQSQFCANAAILCTCSDPSGNVYIAGNFDNAAVNGYYVAKYDGTNWSELGGLNGLLANGSIKTIYSDALGNIYAAGDFTDSSGKYYVAKYNGNSWSELGGLNGLAANSTINSICSDAMGNIYAAGNFTNSSGKCYVAEYNGSSWSELGGLNGLAANSSINSICSDSFGNIYAAGGFTDISGQVYVAKYWLCTAGSSSQADTICTSALPYFWNGSVYTAAGTTTTSFATNTGCDSTVSYTLTVYPDTTTISAVTCPGSPYILGANTYTTTGSYTDTIGQTIHGCDSIITLNLIVLDSSVISYFSLQPSSLPHFWYAINQCTGNQLSYIWSWGDGTTSTGDTPTHTYDSAGYYNICVTVTDSAGCSASYCDSVYLYKNASEMVELKVVFQSPNGIQSLAANDLGINYYADAVHFSEALQAPTQLKLYDLSGRVVMQQDNFSGTMWKINNEIAQGVYIIQLQNGNYSLSKKLMIMQ